MKLYIAGPMSNLPEYNYPAFNDAEIWLVSKGYKVLNPTSNDPEVKSWDNYMRASIAQVLQADGIATLPDWQMSAGAVLEVQIAHSLRIPVLSLTRWLARVSTEVKVI